MVNAALRMIRKGRPFQGATVAAAFNHDIGSAYCGAQLQPDIE
jgi:hypothetical protein